MLGWGKGRRRLGRWFGDQAGGLFARPEPLVAAGQPDLLAEERRRPLRRLAGWLGLTGGRSLKIAAVLAVVFFAVWGVGHYGLLEGESSGDVNPLGGNAGASGSDLSDLGISRVGAGAARRAMDFGRLTGELGSNGLPLIEHGVTGELREVTPVELAFPVYREFIPGDNPGVVWNPGPEGLGMWWEDDLLERATRDVVVMDRWSWRARQEAELVFALQEIRYALRQYDDLDFTRWEYAPAARAKSAIVELRRRHRSLDVLNYWSEVPSQWACDAELQRDLTMGMGLDCPSGELVEQLRVVWTRVGDVAMRIEKLSARAEDMSRMDPLFISTLQMDLRFGLDAVQGEEQLGALSRDLAILSELSREQKLPISLGLWD